MLHEPMKHPSRQLGLLALTAVAGCMVGCSTCKQAIDSNVVHCRQQCQAGLEAERRGRSESAQEMFAAAVETCPADERARCLYAQILWDQGEWDSAVSQMREAVRLSGGDPDTTVRLGQMHLARGDRETAYRHAQKAISASPQLAAAWALEGDVLKQRGELDAALARYHRALVYQDQYPDVQFGIAEIYARQDRHTRALATLSALADQYEPDRIPQRLHGMRGRAYRALDRYSEAAAEFSLAAKAAPPTPDLLYELAETLQASGDSTAARMTAEQALTLQPQHEAAQHLLTQLTRVGSQGSRRF